MRLAIIAMTERGREHARLLCARLKNHACVIAEADEDTWSSFDALIYVCAAGIAVRKIAPYINSKLTDPAVVVCDETGRFAISLLSGHIGGANALAEEIAKASGAAAVITTASDNLDLAREPKNIAVGIGCRRGASAEAIERAVTIALYRHGISVYRVCGLASADIKKNEPGLIAFAEIYALPLSFYPAEELNAAEGDFSSSEFVRETVGTDNVCERAAFLLSGGGRAIIRKTPREFVTVAAYEKREETV